jgi:hypothetical protein
MKELIQIEHTQKLLYCLSTNTSGCTSDENVITFKTKKRHFDSAR